MILRSYLLWWPTCWPPRLAPLKEGEIMRTLTIWFTLAAFLISAGALFGQATDAVLVGNVTDTSGSAVPNVTITATNKDTNVKYTTVTSATGEYRIGNVPVGRYD